MGDRQVNGAAGKAGKAVQASQFKTSTGTRYEIGIEHENIGYHTIQQILKINTRKEHKHITPNQFNIKRTSAYKSQTSNAAELQINHIKHTKENTNTGKPQPG